MARSADSLAFVALSSSSNASETCGVGVGVGLGLRLRLRLARQATPLKYDGGKMQGKDGGRGGVGGGEYVWMGVSGCEGSWVGVYVGVVWPYTHTHSHTHTHLCAVGY